ncbi:MAG: deoxyribonuclease HsdR [Crocinitomicaceae bacterium]|nr:deoxyribonuclease HsdR [Crocinitomicaceae bacterium]|tara:strand:- start:13833 stop:15272 length:1440 start_codon:yes stop_codon:yes gene_type:complete
MRKIIVPLSSAFIGGLIAVASFSHLQKPQVVTERIVQQPAVHSQQVRFAEAGNCANDLSAAAEKSLESVVHVRMVFQGQQPATLFDLFYGNTQPMPAEGTGSGVIISEDGYIVTNHHVVDGAQEIQITLHNRDVYNAKIIGSDPSTDLALIKIEAEGLPFLSYANSEDVKVGEWVLAVGNPFNLNSTVTAGIISAKGRDINILRANPQSGISPVESFIQTDAVVNPGNSGGALVNTAGDLIGINAAIKSNTGSFIGYSFAIPSNITRKVVQDIMEFGSVQRAFLGVSIRNLNSQLISEKSLTHKDGVYVAGLAEKGAAKQSDLKSGDVITKINGKTVNTVAELQEQVSSYRPGDEISVTFLRNNEEQSTKLVLRNQHGNTDVIEKAELDLTASLGADFETATNKMKNRLGISYGVQVMNLRPGKMMKAGVKEKFIIRKVDGKRVNTPNDLINALSGKSGGVLFEGIYPNGRQAYYGIGL